MPDATGGSRLGEQLAAMNEYPGITTLILPAPGLAAMSSTMLRGPGARVSRLEAP